MLALILALLAQNPNTSNIVITSADGSVQVLPPLVPTDIRPALQSAIDWCESHEGRESLRIPPGSWGLSASIELVSDLDLQADGVELHPLDPATFQKSIVLAGAANHPSGGGTRARADRVSITGLTIRQTADTSASSHCLFVDQGDDWRLTRVKAISSKHEGLVSGGLTRRWIWDRCEAEDCGAGSPNRTQSGAGINCNGIDHTLLRCTTRRCGQGYEHGGLRTTWIECRALDGLTSAAPCIGFNLGNSVVGLYRPRLLGCSSTGHPVAAGVGNVNGRCGGVLVEAFDAVDGTIGFAGGKPDNIVPLDDQGPDLERSAFIRCTVHLSSAAGGPCFTYNGGPAATDDVFGRASVDFVDCVADIPTGEPDWMNAAPFSVMGNVTGEVTFIRPVVRGPRGASKAAGDFFLGPNGANVLPAHVPNITLLRPRSFRPDGAERFFVQFRGSPE